MAEKGTLQVGPGGDAWDRKRPKEPVLQPIPQQDQSTEATTDGDRRREHHGADRQLPPPDLGAHPSCNGEFLAGARHAGQASERVDRSGQRHSGHPPAFDGGSVEIRRL